MDDLDSLDRLLRKGVAESATPAQMMRDLVAAHLDRLPMPGGGRTLERWRALALVGQHDLSLAKLFEGHTDALAILDELDAAPADDARAPVWAVWAAEPPDGRVRASADGTGHYRLNGVKRWCSGAQSCTHALLTAWEDGGAHEPRLFQLALAQPGVTADLDGWEAVGMGRSASADVHLDHALGHAVGMPAQYLTRPGFWHGGAGVAACWYGACVALARALQRAVQTRGERAGELLASAAGKVDVAMSAVAALFRQAAADIDDDPVADARALALRVRLATEGLAGLVQAEAMRALGPAPYCQDRQLAQLVADLPIFVRQSHAERDYAALASLTSLSSSDATASSPWML